MEIQTAIVELQPRHEFRIARARKGKLANVFLRIEEENVTGLGEASPNFFYQENATSVVESLASARGWLQALKIRSVRDIERTWDESWQRLAPSRATQCALDLALWDWLARREGVTVAELALGSAPRPVTTFCTIGLSTPEELRVKMRELRGFPAIKIKSDASCDLEPIRFVRERTSGIVAVDANCAWAAADLDALSAELLRLEVSFIEQPLPPGKDAALPHQRSLPILADESCVTEADVDQVAQRYDGFNIKLVKCGGLTPALRMARRGRELGVRTMVGCMIESSALIAAGAVAAQLTDYADLDGAWLLGTDPVQGWRFDRGTLHPPQEPGLGLRTGQLFQQ